MDSKAENASTRLSIPSLSIVPGGPKVIPKMQNIINRKIGSAQIRCVRIRSRRAVDEAADACPFLTVFAQIPHTKRYRASAIAISPSSTVPAASRLRKSSTSRSIFPASALTEGFAPSCFPIQRRRFPIPSPFDADTAATGTPSARSSPLTSARPPCFSRRSVIFSATTTGFPSSISWVVR